MIEIYLEWYTPWNWFKWSNVDFSIDFRWNQLEMNELCMTYDTWSVLTNFFNFKLDLMQMVCKNSFETLGTKLGYDNWDDAFSLKMKQKQVDVTKNELERYVGAENENFKDPSFDFWAGGKENLQSIMFFLVWLEAY